MVTLCVYYGEREWDGPVSLMDMLNIPDELKPVANDYKMNFIQVRDSEQLQFQNTDVQTVFEICRNIYKKNYDEIANVYQSKEIDSELGLVIGAITDSPKLVNQALERKGGRMNMCRALEELEREGIQKGKILARYEDGMPPEEIAKKMGLSVKQVEKILEENKVLALV